MTHFGQKLRKLRKNRGLTLASVATAAGITKGYLSKIEHSPDPPVFSTLHSLVSILGADIGELLSPNKPVETSPNIEIQEPGGADWQKSGKLGGYSYLPLLPTYHNKYLSPFLMHVPRGSTEFFKHDGEEFLHVLGGRVELEYENRTYPLAQGASVYLDSRIRHRFHNRDKKTATVLAVNFVYRRF